MGVVAAAGVPREAPLGRQAPVQAGLGQGGEEAHHGRGDGGLLDEPHLPLEDVAGIAVEAHDEAAGDLHALALDRPDAGEHVGLEVLLLAGGLEGAEVGRLDAEEHHVEARQDHLVHEGLVRGQIEAGFGEEGEGVMVRPLPGDQLGQQGAHLAAVADEVVVHQEERAAPAFPVEQVQLVEELRRTLGARASAEELDDVAELAVEGTAAGELKGHLGVVLPAHQVEAGRGRAGEVGLFRAGVQGLGLAQGEVVQKER